MACVRWLSGGAGGEPDLGVVPAVLLADSVPAERVVVEAGVLDQSHPLTPAGGHVGAVVLVQVLPEEGWVEQHRIGLHILYFYTLF